MILQRNIFYLYVCLIFSEMKMGSLECLSGGSDAGDGEQPVPRWPGLSSVIQSYQNYLSGQIYEKILNFVHQISLSAK